MADQTLRRTPDRTPDRWRDDLLAALDARAPEIARAHRYYDGDHDAPPLPDGCSPDLRRLRQHCVLNLCSLVVDAPIERLAIQGFSFGTDDDHIEAEAEAGSQEEDEPADVSTGIDVWRGIWQRNRLDADSDLVHAEALIARRAFVLVWPDETGEGVDIFPESPAEVYVDYEPGRRRQRRAAIKRFTEGDGQSKVTDVTLWLPGRVHRWRRTGTGPWSVVGESTGPTPAVLGDAIPVVEFVANPDLSGQPHSELDRGVIAIQDRINKTIFDRLVLAEYQAFPQRWATGIDIETDAEGNPVQPFKVGPNRVVTQTGTEVRFGQWDSADMKPHLDAIEADVHGLAAQTKTPVYYLAAEFSNVSADAIRAAEAGLVKKVHRHQRVFGESWEEVLRLALRVLGDPRADDEASTIEWADAETRTTAEQADATLKLRGVLPDDELRKRLGYSPQERALLAAGTAADIDAATPAAAAAEPPPPEPTTPTETRDLPRPLVPVDGPAPDDLVAAAQAQLRTIGNTLATELVALWDGLGSWDRADVERFVLPATDLVTPAVATAVGTQTGLVAALTGTAPAEVDASALVAVVVDDLEDPFHLYWAGLRRVTPDEALEKGRGQAQTIGLDLMPETARRVMAALVEAGAVTGPLMWVVDPACETCAPHDREPVTDPTEIRRGWHPSCRCLVVPATAPAPPPEPEPAEEPEPEPEPVAVEPAPEPPAAPGRPVPPAPPTPGPTTQPQG